MTSRARSFSKLINKDNYATYRGSDSVSDISAVSLPQGTLNFRNKIINGDMRIDQRNAGSAVTANNASNNVFCVDRWQGAGETSDGVFTLQRSTVAPVGFTNSLLATVTTPDSSIGSTQRYFIQQRVEGFNIDDFAWGTASAKSITLSFWVRSSLTGGNLTFGGSLLNSARDRAYPFSYVINEPNIWEHKTITIPGDNVTSTWLTDNGIGILVTWGFGVGSALSDAAGAWTTSSFSTPKWSSTGATNLMGTSGATFYITGVQLEEGPVATPFEHRPYGLELSLCQRYFQSIAMFGLFVFPYHTTLAFVPVPLFVPLRSKSAVSLSKTDRIIRITTPAVIDYWIDGGNNFTSGGDWAHNMYIDNRANRDGSLSHLGLRINKSGSSNFPDQEPLEITGVGPNSSNNGFNDVGGYFEIESEL